MRATAAVVELSVGESRSLGFERRFGLALIITLSAASPFESADDDLASALSASLGAAAAALGAEAEAEADEADEEGAGGETLRGSSKLIGRSAVDKPGSAGIADSGTGGACNQSQQLE